MRRASRLLLVAAAALATAATATPASAGLRECIAAAQSPIGVVVFEVVKCLPDPA
ncbi:MAG TPA: hypothetical protein VF519_17090 [Mycobacteriales bacterium]|jgi:ABC-type sugar transport system substrate-binding protein